ncbi:MAG: hypothetical protein AAFX06_18605 [Planctomycetota bacterium]
MSRLILCCALVLGCWSPARSHELPDGEIERRVQVIVRPDKVSVQYSLAMNRTTLETQLRQLGEQPAETVDTVWRQFQKAIPRVLAKRMTVTVDGQATTLKPVRADFSGWSHRHLVCLLAAPTELTAEPQRVVVKDANFAGSPGDHRIALKPLSGAKMRNATAPPTVSRAEPVRLKGSSNREVKAEGMFFLASVARGNKPFPKELVTFSPSSRNPLFAGTGRETWDHKIRERGCILLDQGKWHLWYTGYRGKRTDTKHLGYATSDDGLKWVRHSDNPVFSESWTEDVHVVRHQDRFYMVAEGRGDIPHLLTSSDGIRWIDEGRLDVRHVDGAPLSAGPYGTPTLWVEGATWYLFYERSDRAVWLAKSSDRKTWTNVSDTPVLNRGPTDYDRYAIALNQIIRYQGRYYGVYHANADPKRQGPWTTCLAVSDDLIHWTKYGGNPIVSTNDSSGQLVFDGDQFRLYTMHPDMKVYFAEPEN